MVLAERGSQERDGRLPMIAVFLDDEPFVQRRWQSCFEDLRGIEVKTPSIETVEDIINFTSGWNEADLSRVSAVVIDQRMPGRKIVSGWLRRLKEVNQDVWVVETSWLPFPSLCLFQETNSFFDKDEIEVVFKIVRQAPEALKVQVFRMATNKGFLRARILEEESTEEGIRLSLLILTGDSWFPRLLEILRKEKEEFIKEILTSEDDSWRIEVLHDSWNIIGHLIAGNDPSFFSVSLARLKGSFS